MISKNKFVTIMNHLRNREDLAKDIMEVHLKYNIPVEEIKPNCPRDFGIEEFILELLEDMFKDSQGLIRTWCYETDFGRNEATRAFFYDGNEIELVEAEDLYDLLVNIALYTTEV